MNMYDSICKKRTIRLFKSGRGDSEQGRIDYVVLERCVNAARLSSSARNSQPLEYVIVDDKDVLGKILPLINFGGFISDDKKAKQGNEPAAMIVIIVKKDSGEYYKYDAGIASQNISLVAYEKGIGSCMMGAIDKEMIKQELSVPDDYFVDLVIALGYPDEQPVAEEVGSEAKGYDYYRKEGILHIPKRELKSVLHRNGF